MVRLSGIIITLNEEKNIKDAILSLKEVCDEVIIVDAFSKDNTVNIAKKLGAKVFQREWDNYVNQRNYAIDKANGEWILFIDADERLSSGLIREIKDRIIKKGGEGYNGFLIPRKNWYLGSWSKTWYPDRILRIFKKNFGRWVGGFAHEKIEVKGKIGKFKNPLLHYPYKNLFDQYQRNLKYALLMAKTYKEEGKKSNFFNLVLRPFFNFLKFLILKGGIFEGWRGIIYAFSYLAYSIQKYTILWELQNGGDKLWRK